MKEAMCKTETEIPLVTVTLSFMDRDTVLACLKDLAEIKERYAKTALTQEEMVVANAQAKTAQELYDKIYEQKLSHYKEYEF